MLFVLFLAALQKLDQYFVVWEFYKKKKLFPVPWIRELSVYNFSG